MSVDNIKNQAKQKMDKTMSDMTHAIASVRTGRANIALLDGVKVDYYGTPTPINQVATLHVPEPAMITAQPWDVSLIGAIEKAIRSSDLGLNPQNDGKVIRVPIPPLTQDRRQQLVKHLQHVAEEHRVAVRKARQDANDQLKKHLKDKSISEDDERRALAEIQKMTDTSIKRIDDASKAKEKEILEFK